MLITCPKCSAKYKIPDEINLKKGQKVQCSACEHIFEFISTMPEEVEKKAHLLPPEDAVLSVSSKTEKIVIQTKEADEPFKKESVPLPEAFRPVEARNIRYRLPFGTIVLCFALLVCLIGIGWLWRDLLVMNTSFDSSVIIAKHRPGSSRLSKRSLKQTNQKERPSEKTEVDTSARVATPVEKKEEPVSSVSSAVPVVQAVRFRKTPTGAVLIEGTLKNTTSETVSVPEKVYALAYGEDGALLFEKEIYLPAGILYPGMEQAFFGTYASVEKGVQWVDVVLQK